MMQPDIPTSASRSIEPSRRCRVFLVDNNADLAQTLIELLRFEPDLEPVGWTSTSAHALSDAAERAADVIIVDLSLPDGSGLALIERASTAASERPALILYTGHDSADLRERALRHGASACVTKGGDTGALFAAIRAAHAARAG